MRIDKSRLFRTQGMAYKYDQLNRVKEARALRNLNVSTNIWGSGPSYNNEYFNSFVYDPNGNIEEQQRYNEAGVQFDFLKYNYHVQEDPDGWDRTKRNRLYHVNDVGSSTVMPDDLEDQGAFEEHDPSGGIDINVKNNYGYDQLGQLIRDHDDDAVSPSGEEIELISWRVDGKISEVKRITGSTKKNLRFVYDAMGNRVAKKVYSDNTFSLIVLESTTYYVRDAQGNVMSVYENPDGGVSPTLELREQHIYGSSRVGMRSVNIEMIQVTDPLATEMIEVVRGEKYFELTNHLGNVLVTISDQKIAMDNLGQIAYYSAEVMTFTDYYPFGSVMSERTWTAQSGYRYGFGRKEEDTELAENGISLDFGSRIYESRLGRWISIDPLYKNYPSISTYCYTGNSPIAYVDPNGKEIKPASDSSQDMIAKALLSIFKDRDILIGLFNFNTRGDNNVELLDKMTYGDLTYKQFRRVLRKQGKQNGVSFTNQEINLAYNAYQIIESDIVTEVWVTESSAYVDNGDAENAARTSTANIDTQLLVTGPNLVAVFTQLQQDERNNTTSDDSGVKTVDLINLASDKAATLRRNTNSNGVGRPAGGTEILIDVTAPPSVTPGSPTDAEKVQRVAQALTNQI